MVSEMQPVNPELFHRTAPAFNCVANPGDGPHYLSSTGDCQWCGMTKAQIRAEWLAQQSKEN